MRSELKTLRKKHGDLVAQGNIYIGRKNDRIDQSLQKFINTYPERDNLKILFLRESEGVYQFGTRRVYIKIEKGNKIVVRVGGGFMEIGDFLNQFTDNELQKMERKREVIQRFQNKLKTQMLSSRVSIYKTETSPVTKRRLPRSQSNHKNR